MFKRSKALVQLFLKHEPASLNAQDAQVINVPLSRPGEPIHLEIGIQSARIEVIGEDREDAQFEVSVADGNRKIVTPSGTKSLKGGGYALEVEEDDNEIFSMQRWLCC